MCNDIPLNNFIGADNTSQNLIDVILLRSIPSNRFVWYYLHLSHSLVGSRENIQLC